jgi:transcriptional regulator with XRE-family HTH domain
MPEMSLPEIDPEKKKDPFLKYIGEELFSLRKGHEMSIKKVAKNTKMSPAIISKVEKGLYENLGVERFCRLCEYYKAPVKDVLGRVEQRQRTDNI